MNNFSDIIGNEQIIKSIRRVLKNKMISHAYIIAGEEGGGKKMLANAFAKTLLCETDGDEPCDQCISCRTFDGGNNPDIIYVHPVKTKGISVDDIREQVTSTVNIKPYNHRYKIYIMPNADTMTQQAQNALLKTLEEPPEYAVFFLLAENIYAFLPTIMSRCVLFNIKPVPAFKIKNYLLERKLADEQADMVAEYAQGSIGKAIRFAESEEFSAMRQKVTETLSGIKNAPYYVLTEAAKELAANNDAADITDMIYLWQRDVLAYKITEDKNCIIEKDMTDRIVDEARNNSYEALCGVPEFIMKTKKYLKQNVNSQFALEMLFINIKGELVDDRSSRS